MPTAILSRDALARVLRSLLADEFRRARGRDARLPAAAPEGHWPEDLAIGDGGLGCDSLERLSLAAAANEMFHLHEAGTETNLLSGARFGDWLDTIEAARRRGLPHVTFTTSGTTGRPKRCLQAVADLATETAVLAERWADRRRVVALVPAHHIYGLLFCALLPDRLQVPVLDAEPLGIAALAAALAPGDLVVSFPDRWAFLGRSLPAWPPDVLGVTSTAPCPPGLPADLRRAGLAGLTEVYGSSETAGIAMRDDPGHAFRLMPQWHFVEPVDDAAPVLIHRSGREVGLMDRILRTGVDAFCLAGRRDGMVQVGGVNVAPDGVARRLRALPGVREAAVRPMRPDPGSRLKAYLVPDPDVDPVALEAAVALWAARNLSSAERPIAFTTGPTLPTGPLGKTADW